MADGGRSVEASSPWKGAVHTVAFSADGTLLAIGTRGRRLVEVWDLASRRRRHSFALPGANAPSPCLLPRRKNAGRREHDGTTVLWDLETGQAVGRPLVGLRGAVEHVTIDADASHITTASATGVASWDLQGTALSTHRRLGFPDRVRLSGRDLQPRWTPSRHDRPEGQLSIRDKVTLQPRGRSVRTASSDCCSYVAAFSPDGRSVVAGSGAQLSSIDVRTRTVDRPPLDVGAPLSDLEFSQDGRLLAVGTNEGTAVLVDVERWSIRRRVAVSRDRARTGPAPDSADAKSGSL